jgi:hypothetical protein
MNICLADCNNDNTPEFSLCGLTLQGRVVACYDADTCKIALPLNNKVSRTSIIGISLGVKSFASILYLLLYVYLL